MVGIKFKGFEEMIEKLEALGGDIKPIVEECLEASADIITPKLKTDMTKHNKTKKVVNSLEENGRVTWEGTKARIPVGFKLRKGGWASIYLMYGTARHAPANQYGTYGGTVRGVTQDKKLHDDVYGASVRRQINTKQKEIFNKEINKRMGGK